MNRPFAAEHAHSAHQCDRGHAPARLLTILTAALSLTFGSLGPAAADETDNYKTVDGLGVYLGILPAAMVEGHPKAHAEAEMHGGPPSGAHAYHIIIAIFEETSGERVEDAKVSAVVSGLGQIGRTNVTLEPMSIEDTVTYGAFIDLAGMERFNIAVSITGPEKHDPVRVDFVNEHF